MLSGTLTDGTAISATISQTSGQLGSTGSGASVTFAVPAAPSILHHAIGSFSGTSGTLSITSTTAGNLLVATVTSYTTGAATMPAGWVKALDYGTNPYASVWYYPANPGGITSVTATVANPVIWIGEIAGIGTPTMVMTSATGGTTPGGSVSGAGISPDVSAFVVSPWIEDNADIGTTPTGGFAITDSAVRGANNGTTVLTQVVTGGTYTPGLTYPSGNGYNQITAAFRQ